MFFLQKYNEADQGLYECTAENDLRVSKIVYNLKETYDFLSREASPQQPPASVPLHLVPIGSSNDYRDKSRVIQSLDTDTYSATPTDPSGLLEHKLLEPKTPKPFRTKAGYHFHHQQQKQTDESSSASILSQF